MHLRRFKIGSYFSFDDSDWIELSSEFNIFVGTNNSGKSALLRSLSQQFSNVPHRRPDRYAAGDLKKSFVNLEVLISAREIFRRFAAEGVRVNFPGSNRPEQENYWINAIDNNQELIVNAQKIPADNANFIPNGSTFSPSVGDETGYEIALEDEGPRLVRRINGGINTIDFLNFSRETPIFYFEPQRMHVGEAAFQEDSALNSSASNLPNVLAYLAGSRPDVLKNIEELCHYITQSVKSITVRPHGNDAEIVFWPSADRSRSEFAMSLKDSGTGIGQVIAILTAVSTASDATLVIDEVNTFLHPAATKRLLSVLQTEFGHHQYIVSTHSSDVLGVSGSAAHYIVSKNDLESQVKRIKIDQVQDIRAISSIMGFSMMDVFGHERMVWVEGETEQKVFPYLARERGIKIPDGLGFATVGLTSEFDKKDRSLNATIELYTHISQSSSPLLRGMAFGLDRESRDEESVDRLQRSKRKLRFLPRRCLECYFLQPAAIASVLRDAGNGNITEELVMSFLVTHGGDAAYRAASLWKGDLGDVKWLSKVDAAKLLKACFGELTEQREEYRKIIHGLALARAIQESTPEQFDELSDYIEQLIGIAGRDTRP